MSLPLLERLGRFTPFVRKMQTHQGPTFTAGEANVRTPVAVAPQAAPDPIRDGFTPSRPAMVQIVTFGYDMGVTLDDPRFQVANYELDPTAARPRGRMSPDVQRQNIALPAHVAYGSMLANNYQAMPYWGN